MRREFGTLWQMLTVLLMLSLCIGGHAAAVSKGKQIHAAAVPSQHKNFRMEFIMDITKMILNIIGKIR